MLAKDCRRAQHGCQPLLSIFLILTYNFRFVHIGREIFVNLSPLPPAYAGPPSPLKPHPPHAFRRAVPPPRFRGGQDKRSIAARFVIKYFFFETYEKIFAVNKRFSDESIYKSESNLPSPKAGRVAAAG